MKRRKFLSGLLGAIASVAVFKAETVEKLFAPEPVQDWYTIEWPVTSHKWYDGYGYSIEYVWEDGTTTFVPVQGSIRGPVAIARLQADIAEIVRREAHTGQEAL